MAAGDLDNDGDLDLVVTTIKNLGSSTYAASVFFVENTGTATTPTWSVDTTPIQTITGTTNATVALADLDGDGDVDLLINYSDIAGGSSQNLAFVYLENQTPVATDTDTTTDTTTTNNPPSTPILVSPANEATLSGSSATLYWDESTDLDADTLTYTVDLCTDAAMTIGCDSTTNAASVAAVERPQKQLPWQNVAIAAEVGPLADRSNISQPFAGAWWLLALGGLLGGIALSPYKRKTWAYAVIMLVFGLSSCRNNEDASVTVATTTATVTADYSVEFSNLSSGTYYWTVTASDGTDTTASSVYTFTIN
ncbi:MAG: FG-GAP-like repeat-containing protein [SAR324 cluster bacterium]|nr:FG-GAP-like repeat-containing protein [SAR324 cluster bacterium]